jgi:hypothetical protein
MKDIKEKFKELFETQVIQELVNWRGEAYCVHIDENKSYVVHLRVENYNKIYTDVHLADQRGVILNNAPVETVEGNKLSEMVDKYYAKQKTKKITVPKITKQPLVKKESYIEKETIISERQESNQPS